MLFLGLLLLAATGAFTALAIADNLSGGPQQYGVSVLGHHIATLSPLGLFCSGLALALIFCLGLAMVSGAAHHRRSPRPRRAHRRTTVGPMMGPGTRA
ncbi:hypothetical protein M878_04930 [Streptomyces roseochromogenus subsp. oscitans DS 12.976]|uniref:MHYT domain-containing protein n=2 Tax=Streptomyces roseochromogenus TaxID=285450 RepID=V6KWD8_STRRC|nr:hypothetical protein M878_04930 [Streptomyces roseochromogenus subsp. oscitans DS 12.976]